MDANWCLHDIVGWFINLEFCFGFIQLIEKVTIPRFR